MWIFWVWARKTDCLPFGMQNTKKHKAIWSVPPFGCICSWNHHPHLSRALHRLPGILHPSFCQSSSLCLHLFFLVSKSNSAEAQLSFPHTGARLSFYELIFSVSLPSFLSSPLAVASLGSVDGRMRRLNESVLSPPLEGGQWWMQGGDENMQRGMEKPRRQTQTPTPAHIIAT